MTTPVLLNPSREGFTLLMTNGDSYKVSIPARFWNYREVPDQLVPDFLQKGWTRCPFQVAHPTRYVPNNVSSPDRMMDGEWYQVHYTEEVESATLLLPQPADAHSA